MQTITFENVWHYYARGTSLETVSLSGLDLGIDRGELVVLAGPAGSGKSTLLQLLNGLLRPHRGRVLVNGGDTRHKKVRSTLWSRVGLVMQYPEKQFFEETVYREILFGPKNLGLSGTEIHERVSEALAMVGLDGAAAQSQSPFRLSGGEQRRVALASVLALRPEILALDEPTAGIDPGGRKKILDFISKLKTEQCTTIVMATHNMDEAAALADRVVILNKGEIVLEGPPGIVFANHGAVRGVGLDLPFPCEVINRLNGAGFGVNGLPLTMEEAERLILKRLFGQ